MPTLSNFIQYFNLSNWSVNKNTGQITQSYPTSVTMVSSTLADKKTSFRIQIPISGTISFDYSCNSTGYLGSAPFGYVFAGGNIIVTNYPSDSIANGTISVNVNENDNFQLYTVQNNNGGGPATTTTITNFNFSYQYPECFNEGTKILCFNNTTLSEEYIEIEKLRKGDTVKSYLHGYRKIDLIGKKKMINNPDVFIDCMYKLEKTPENGLIDDLIVTGGHSILVDDFKDKNVNASVFGECQMIDDKCLLLVGTVKEFVKQENNDVYTYYHFILENDNDDSQRFGVWANGMLTDTPAKTESISQHYELI